MSVKRKCEPVIIWLADFLNFALPGATETGWQKLAKKAATTLGGPHELASMPLAEALALRCNIHRALAFLASEPRELKKASNPFLELGYQLHDLKLPTNYSIMEIKSRRRPLPGEQIFVSKDDRRWGIYIRPYPRTPAEQVYCFVAEALSTGAVKHLKVCRWQRCKKYAAVRDAKREFCEGSNCKDDYFNNLKKKSPRQKTFSSPAQIKKLVKETAQVKQKSKRETVFIECGCKMIFKDARCIEYIRCKKCARTAIPLAGRKRALRVGEA